MSAIGLRVGPFEVEERVIIPEAGDWFLARRTGMTRKQPSEVMVRLLGPSPGADSLGALQSAYDRLRQFADDRVPAAHAFYEGTGALAVHAVRGSPLARLVERRADETVAMDPATLLDIALELCDTLVHVHNKGGVHGHLGGHNIVLAHDGRIWVWGIGSGPSTVPPAPWTSPERANGQPATPLTDQWCLGALMAALVTGAQPWPDGLAAARVGDASTFIEPVEAQWPSLGRLLRRLTETEPRNRMPGMGAVRKELLALRRKAGGTSGRRELGSVLARLDPITPPREESPPSMPTFTEHDANTSPEVDSTDIPSARRTAHSATSLGSSALVDETLEVVRPDVPAEMQGSGDPDSLAEPPSTEMMDPAMLQDILPTEMAQEFASELVSPDPAEYDPPSIPPVRDSPLEPVPVTEQTLPKFDIDVPEVEIEVELTEEPGAKHDDDHDVPPSALFDKPSLTAVPFTDPGERSIEDITEMPTVLFPGAIDDEDLGKLLDLTPAPVMREASEAAPEPAEEDKSTVEGAPAIQHTAPQDHEATLPAEEPSFLLQVVPWFAGFAIVALLLFTLWQVFLS